MGNRRHLQMLEPCHQPHGRLLTARAPGVFPPARHHVLPGSRGKLRDRLDDLL